MTAENPSPTEFPPGPLIFLLDARHRVDSRLLNDWLDELLSSRTDPADVSRYALPIAFGGRQPELVALTEALRQSPDATVLPLRASWSLPDFDTSRGIPLWYLLLGDPRSPGYLRAWLTQFFHPKRVRCFAGQGATVSELQGRYRQTAGEQEFSENFTRFVLRQAGITLDLAERQFRGSRYKVPRFVAESLYDDPRFREAISAAAEETGKPREAIEREAAGYMAEMISKPTPFFIDVKARLERWLLSLGYNETLAVDTADIELFRRVIREKPTLVLFTHKTYLDGLAATDIAYRNDLPLIHTFGGINMAMPGLSTMMRGAGGIFIRRSFRDNPVYKLVLRHYISYLLEKRFAMTWAFEGTRSRIGKLMPPRYGLLKYVIDAAHSNDVRDLHFLPVSISFDLIRDVEDYVAEQSGRMKKPETLGWFLGYLRSLRSPRGKIYVNFGEPVVVEHAPDPADSLALAKIAFEVAVRANQVTPFTLNSLMCFILLGAAPRGMTAEELHIGLAYFVDWGRKRGIRMADVLERNDQEVQDIAKTLLNSGLFLRYDQGSRVVYAIEPSKHAVASYYRNTIVHHFLECAIIELSLLKLRETPRRDDSNDSIFWAETARLRELFKFEFFYPERDVFRKNLEAELGRNDPDWQAKLNGHSGQLDSLINHFSPLKGHTVFLPLVEAYTVVFIVLTSHDLGQVPEREACINRAVKEARFAYLMRHITTEASIAHTLFDNAFSLADNLGLCGETTPENLAARKALLKELRALSRRMEISRILSLRMADDYFFEE